MPLQRGDFERAWRIIDKWARRNAVRAHRRTVAPLLAAENGSLPLIDRWLALVAPWEVREYPPRPAIILAICGLKGRGHLTRWRRDGIIPHAAEKMAAFLESRIIREQMLVEELRAAAARRRETTPQRYLARVPKTELEIIQRRGLAAKRARAAARKAAAAREAAMIAEVIGIRDAGQ